MNIIVFLTQMYINDNWFGQIIVMYCFNLVLESGFYIQYYMIIYHFELIEFEN